MSSIASNSMIHLQPFMANELIWFRKDSADMTSYDAGPVPAYQAIANDTQSMSPVSDDITVYGAVTVQQKEHTRHIAMINSKMYAITDFFLTAIMTRIRPSYLRISTRFSPCLQTLLHRLHNRCSSFLHSNSNSCNLPHNNNCCYNSPHSNNSCCNSLHNSNSCSKLPRNNRNNNNSRSNSPHNNNHSNNR